MDEKAADLLSLEFIHDALWKLIVTAQIAQGQCELGDKEGLHRTLKQLIACAREATGEYKEVLAREAGRG
jgi:hypothetical protein